MISKDQATKHGKYHTIWLIDKKQFNQHIKWFFSSNNNVLTNNYIASENVGEMAIEMLTHGNVFFLQFYLKTHVIVF